MLSLRPYQQTVVDRLLDKLDETTNPILAVASVGAGKSLICAEVLRILSAKGWRCLCLTMSSTLVQQNNDTYISQGGLSGIYCGTLNLKDTEQNVIFGTPNSTLQAIRKHEPLSRVSFNLIIIDECHNVDSQRPESMYMRIIHHYGNRAQGCRDNFRIIGLTGTPYRGKNKAILGDTQLFKERVCNISTSWLIHKHYLTKPVFDQPKVSSLDFSKIKVNNMGKFSTKDLNAVVNKSHRLTADIMAYLVFVIESGRNGVFIFASTLQHCEECMAALPVDESACITGNTPAHERERILHEAREGKIKYLVNIACLLVGVDCPRFDTVCFVRPTESPVLFTQAMGRALRLYPNKKDALILDFAGNLKRFQDWEDPVLTQALAQTRDKDAELIFECPECSTMNSEFARRCTGFVSKKRCNFYFEFKDCPQCYKKNDIAARYCIHCKGEIIDPNSKLTFQKNAFPVTYAVMKARYYICQVKAQVQCQYTFLRPTGEIGSAAEIYILKTQYHKNIFYGKFVREAFNKPSKHYPYLLNLAYVNKMMKQIKPLEKITITEVGRSTRVVKRYYHAPQDNALSHA